MTTDKKRLYFHYHFPRDKYFEFELPDLKFGIPLTQQPHFIVSHKQIERKAIILFPEIKHINASADTSSREYIYDFRDEHKKLFGSVRIFFSYRMLIDLVINALEKGMEILKNDNRS